ncbi:hypothetical protein LPN01_17120 [Sphingomonas sp. A2-49]|uniref:hypothetical protein n=1 Tax=Sphingomonas sp. A2-49 TaxID=1391375 RepID=UPI0021CF0330|nr:hypothetical protein [Sphingomonas sp. A2-49]MCU6455804.1 hypothetical protein [Sphingomonas sp. A2-49]
MKVTLAALLGDAWALFRRDADLLLRVAGLFLFVPTYAMLLLVGPLPLPDSRIVDTQARAQAWMNGLDAWVGDYGLGSAGAYAITYFGLAVVFCLLLDPMRPTVGEALGRGATLFPRFILATVIVSIPAGAGMYILLLPGLWLMSRFMLAGPIVFAQAPIGAVAAIGRSWQATRRAQLSLLGAIVTVYLGGLLAGQPFMLLARWLGSETGGNPIGIALAHAVAAGVAMLSQLAGALIAVAAYRRLAAAR